MTSPSSPGVRAAQHKQRTRAGSSGELMVLTTKKSPFDTPPHRRERVPPRDETGRATSSDPAPGCFLGRGVVRHGQNTIANGHRAREPSLTPSRRRRFVAATSASSVGSYPDARLAATIASRSFGRQRPESRALSRRQLCAWAQPRVENPSFANGVPVGADGFTYSPELVGEHDLRREEGVLGVLDELCVQRRALEITLCRAQDLDKPIDEPAPIGRLPTDHDERDFVNPIREYGLWYALSPTYSGQKQTRLAVLSTRASVVPGGTVDLSRIRSTGGLYGILLPAVQVPSDDLVSALFEEALHGQAHSTEADQADAADGLANRVLGLVHHRPP
jgi:hypothetical protein